MPYSRVSSFFLNFFILIFLIFVGIFIYFYSEEKIDSSIISFNGEHEVSYVPNRAKLNFDIVRINKEAEVAQQEVSKVNSSLFDFFSSNEINPSDIKTLNFNVYPKYEYVYNADTEKNERTFLGYEVSVSIEVTLRDIEKIGTIISGVLDEGVNNFNNLYFYLDEKDLNNIKNEATALAILDAKNNAKLISESSDTVLGKIIKINIQPNTHNPINNFNKVLGSLRTTEGSVLKEDTFMVTPGENKFKIFVTVDYELKN